MNNTTLELVEGDITDLDVEAIVNAANENLVSVSYYTSDAADERSSVDLGGRRIIKKKKQVELGGEQDY